MRAHRMFAIGAVVAAGFLLMQARAPQTVSAQTKHQTKHSAKAQQETLLLCGKCASPTVFEKTGIGTEHAVAKAKITFQDAKDNCQAFEMDGQTNCDQEAKDTLKQENGKIYTATADCVHGKLTDANGENFVYAGLWQTADLPRWASNMKGQTRWRWGAGSDADTGKIVGFDGPTQASMVAATAKLLCPAGVGANRHAR